MVATPLQITNGRMSEGTDVLAMRQLCNATSGGNFTYDNPGGGSVNVIISSEGGDAGSRLKRDAIDAAIKAVTKAGFRLPANLTFHCSSNPGVTCRAFMGDPGGAAVYTVFMGPKTGQHNPQVGNGGGIKGGAGANGERGVSDQMYDGTHRWFGNPKQLAHATCVVIHELGHVLHDFNDEGQYWDFKRDIAPANPSGWLNAACDISHYATRNPMEMVAETFAGAVCGKSYKANVRTAYQALGGATPQGGVAFP